MAMICYQLEEVDEGTDLGLFDSAEKAMKYFDELDLDEPLETHWIQWEDGVWRGSHDGEVVACVIKRTVY